MDADDEQAFRRLLDERGLLRPHALAAPDRSAAYSVFAQREDARLDLEPIRAQARRFFDVRLGLSVSKDYGATAPEADAARIMLASAGGRALGTRLCFGRPTDRSDLEAAERAEQIQRTHGMSLLARRCKVVWLVAASGESAATGLDPVALTIAAVLASTLLGPILTPGGDELFGVKTARAKLEAARGAGS